MSKVLGEFLDSHEEPHALAIGAGLGLAAVATGRLEALGFGLAIVAEVFERARRPPAADRQNVLNDIRREPHYFLGGLVAGAVVGALVR